MCSIVDKMLIFCFLSVLVIYCCVTHHQKLKQQIYSGCGLTPFSGDQNQNGVAGWFDSRFLRRLSHHWENSHSSSPPPQWQVSVPVGHGPEASILYLVGFSEATRVSSLYGSWPPQRSKRGRSPKMETAVCQNPVVKVMSCPVLTSASGFQAHRPSLLMGERITRGVNARKVGSSGPSWNLATTLRQRCFLNSMVKEAN